MKKGLHGRYDDDMMRIDQSVAVLDFRLALKSSNQTLEPITIMFLFDVA